MGRYLEIADQALSEITEDQSLTESEPKGDPPTHCELSELSEISPLVESVDKWSKKLRESPDELRRAYADDWKEVSADPAKLKSFAELVMIEDMRHRGIVPDHYTATTNCKHCGPVPIFEGCWPESDGCPWCFNRLKGLPMPKEG